METWLSHPAMQAAAIPFVAAFAVALALGRTRWLAFAQVIGFVPSATLAIGWSIESLTSTRKLAIIGAAVLVLCVLVEWGHSRWRATATASCAVLAVACVWMLWRLLAQRDAGAAVLAAVLAATYVAAQAAMMLRAGEDPVRAAAAGSTLGWATGVVALLGASAVLGTVALAVGSAAFATLGVQWLRGAAAPTGRSISLPAATVAGLAGVNAVMAAELPGYALLPLLLVVPAARLAPSTLGVRPRAIAAVALAIVPAAAAVALAWFHH
ncbi:MAG TPA: hypothetical protein VIE63_03805, partial [Ramlibacter sp.]